VADFLPFGSNTRDQFPWHKDVAGVICRSFLDCVAAMRSDAPAGAGCYPLIDYYKNSLSHQIIKNWRAANKPAKK
jgi:hypothetical protein